MSIECKECDMVFHTQRALELHTSIFHKKEEKEEEEPEKKPVKTKRTKKKTDLSPDGKPRNFEKWIARMERSAPLGYKEGDKVAMSQLQRDLKSYKLYMEERLSGRAPFVVKKSEEGEERSYVLESSAYQIQWRELKAFKQNKKLSKKDQERWYITKPRVVSMDFVKKRNKRK
jgi:hypothetical protein